MLENIEMISMDEFEDDMKNLLNVLKKNVESEEKVETEDTKIKKAIVSVQFISCFLRCANYVTDLMLEESNNKDFNKAEEYKRVAIMVDTISDIFMTTEEIASIEDTLENWKNLDDVPPNILEEEKLKLFNTKKSLAEKIKKYEGLYDRSIIPNWEYPDLSVFPELPF